MPKKVEGFAGHVPAGKKEGAGGVEQQQTQMMTTQRRGPLHQKHLLPHLSPTLLLHPLLLHNLLEEGEEGQCDPGKSHLRWNGRF
ncbi:hypothetical protein ATANTOWER_029119 [Ataeniobius toweri]|uniref:Uncharacterized protein n=1 Tax=Ataeniobius toweri TaxID=208326 RepID=A0ABU7BBN7_9TELE|nr:hypothetical protein [Ataeniobius toweri]